MKIMTLGKRNIMAALAYAVFFLPLLMDNKKDSFVRFHVRQGLGLLILFLAFRFLTLFILSPLSRIFDPAYSAILYLTNIILLILFGWGVWHALQDEERPLPFVGSWMDKHLKV